MNWNYGDMFEAIAAATGGEYFITFNLPLRRAGDGPGGDVVGMVSVDVPLRRLFDYRCPPGIEAARLQPGCRLWVPFGRRRIAGPDQHVPFPCACADRPEHPVGQLRPPG